MILGLIAAVFTTISQLPQLIKVIKTKNTQSISLNTYILLTIGLIIWGVYGITINDIPLIISNSIMIVMTSLIIVYKIKFKL